VPDPLAGSEKMEKKGVAAVVTGDDPVYLGQTILVAAG